MPMKFVESRQAAGTDIVSELATQIRDEVLGDFDSKVEELWQQGQQMLSAVRQHQQQRHNEVAQEVACCLEKQRAMEIETRLMRQMLAGLSMQLSLLGAGNVMSNFGSQGVDISTGKAFATSSPQQSNGSDAFDWNSYASSLTVPPFPFPADYGEKEACWPAAPVASGTAGVAPAPASLSLAEALGVDSPPMKAKWGFNGKIH